MVTDPRPKNLISDFATISPCTEVICTAMDISSITHQLCSKHLSSLMSPQSHHFTSPALLGCSTEPMSPDRDMSSRSPDHVSFLDVTDFYQLTPRHLDLQIFENRSNTLRIIIFHRIICLVRITARLHRIDNLNRAYRKFCQLAAHRLDSMVSKHTSIAVRLT